MAITTGLTSWGIDTKHPERLAYYSGVGVSGFFQPTVANYIGAAEFAALYSYGVRWFRVAVPINDLCDSPTIGTANAAYMANLARFGAEVQAAGMAVVYEPYWAKGSFNNCNFYDGIWRDLQDNSGTPQLAVWYAGFCSALTGLNPAKVIVGMPSECGWYKGTGLTGGSSSNRSTCWTVWTRTANAVVPVIRQYLPNVTIMASDPYYSDADDGTSHFFSDHPGLVGIDAQNDWWLAWHSYAPKAMTQRSTYFIAWNQSWAAVSAYVAENNEDTNNVGYSFDYLPYTKHGLRAWLLKVVPAGWRLKVPILATEFGPCGAINCPMASQLALLADWTHDFRVYGIPAAMWSIGTLCKEWYAGSNSGAGNTASDWNHARTYIPEVVDALRNRGSSTMPPPFTPVTINGVSVGGQTVPSES